MQAVHWRLLAELSDGLPKHIAALAGKAGVKPQQLNGLWLKMPAHIRGLLRQQDGYWRLVRPLAFFRTSACLPLRAVSVPNCSILILQVMMRY